MYCLKQLMKMNHEDEGKIITTLSSWVEGDLSLYMEVPSTIFIYLPLVQMRSMRFLIAANNMS